jgi:nicotinate-nucleotide adenylyltransferase
LLHSKTGAVLARALFGVSDAVYEAILCHTTGKAGMTKLDKVIYLADYIEPNRNLDGIEQLRSLSYLDIDQAVAMGIKMAVADLRERGKTPCAASLEALTELTES